MVVMREREMAGRGSGGRGDSQSTGGYLSYLRFNKLETVVQRLYVSVKVLLAS